MNRQARRAKQIPLLATCRRRLKPGAATQWRRWMGLCPCMKITTKFPVDTNKDLFYCYGWGRADGFALLNSITR